jgi:1-acyl-sn-glycerol-3-phosphate acyltransferase
VSLNPCVVNHVCRSECITADDVVPQVSWPHYAVRQIGLLATHGLAIVLGFISAFLAQRAARRLLQVWARSVIRVAGITVEVDGDFPRSGPMLVVANHVSFFDALAVLSRFPRIVSLGAQQIARNPIIGRISRNAGTIFVDGTTPAAIPAMVRDVTSALRAGHVVLAYPEGTLRCREPGGPFPPAVLQCAITANAPVQPMLIRCMLRDGTPTAQGCWFTYNEPITSMFRRVLRIRGLVIKISTFPTIDATTTRDRRELARIAKAPLDSAAGPMPRTCVAVTPHSTSPHEKPEGQRDRNLTAQTDNRDSKNIVPV